jgi:acetyltransferase
LEGGAITNKATIALNNQVQPTSFERMFTPDTVAVIGATEREGSVGRSVLSNLKTSSFRGKIYGVNPKRQEILGLPCYPSIGEIPGKIDLAIIVTPAPTVPGIVGECVKAEVGAAVVISAGFKERGAQGAELERQVQERLSHTSMRLIGPNCLGIMNPIIGLNATFSHDMGQPGNVAFLSQSGALLTAILDWSLREQVGFSAIVSTGSMLDIGWGDLIDHFGNDPETRSILLYMESVGDARSFLSAAREVALRKPIIVIKVGRTEAASRAATSHTGAMTGSDEVFDAALRRCGVLRVHAISDLFHMAEILARQPRPKGPRLTILTNAGGPGVLATDALIANGGELAPLADSSVQSLSEFLSPHWSHNNPIDILGDAGPSEYARAVDIAIRNPESDGLLVVLCPQGMTDPAKVAEGLRPYAKGAGKPVLASWMGGKLVAQGEEILNDAGIPTFAYPDTAARMFDYMWQYSKNLHAIYETTSLVDEVKEGAASQLRVEAVLEGVRRKGRTLLTEIESKQVLQHYGIPVVDTRIARGEEEAAAIARQFAFPVVLKVHSETITHKTDVGGVKLDLCDEESVRSAYRAIEKSVCERARAEEFLGVTVQPMVKLDGYEIILGSSVDGQFGPVLLFGSGGQLVEVYRDHALTLPALTITLAQRWMERTHIYKALKGVRGRAPIDMRELERILVRFSQLVVEQPWIKEIDINPLLASPKRLLALDARVVLHGPETSAENLPRPAIRPYPMQHVGRWTLKDGTPILFRPIRPEDETLMGKFHETLSDQSVYLRFFRSEKLSIRVAHERLIRQCFIDYDREMALVAEKNFPSNGRPEILAVGRLKRIPGTKESELAALVTDHYQNQGLGTELVRRLIQVAHEAEYKRVVANVLPENDAMRTILQRMSFRIQPTDDPEMFVGVLEL